MNDSNTYKNAILTPPAPETPRINGPGVLGVKPGSPILYSIPATGKRPMTFSASNLPQGIKVDPESGIISGNLSKTGSYEIVLGAENSLGKAERKLRIFAGDNIALTPPMGWNSWNCWGEAVSQEKVLSSARGMVEKGLTQHGWSFINVDDGWQATRDPQTLAIHPNNKFPDMKALADTIHSMGLKFGLYSTPWRGSYAGFIGGSGDSQDGNHDWIKEGDHDEHFHIGKNPGSERKQSNWTFGTFSFAKQDVAKWVEWGIDYLKYDWFPNDLEHTTEMGEALRTSGRDVVYSLSNTALYENAPHYARLSNTWRTSGDISDTWASISRNGFNQDRWVSFTGPGHWADPDMLVVGQVGWGPQLHVTGLSPDEQYSHISLWCLLSAPLLIGCDISNMDDFTLSLLSNDEVLALDQDALGVQATQISSQNNKVIYAKPLEDGSIGIGLFNRGETEEMLEVSWGPWGNLPTQFFHAMTVRDLWRQKDLGVFGGKFETLVPPHGVVLVRMTKTS